MRTEVGDKDGDKNYGHRVRDNGTFENSQASESKRSDRDHDDRRTAARDGRHSGRRLTSERGLWKTSEGEVRAPHKAATASGAKEREGKSRVHGGDHKTLKERGWWKDTKGEEQAPHKAAATSDAKEKEGKSRVRGVDDHERQQDIFSEAMADAHPPTKKRRPFREEKIPPKPEDVDKNVVPEYHGVSQTSLRRGKWEDRAHDRRPLERNEQNQSYTRESSFSNRGRMENTRFPVRNRFDGVRNDGKFKGRDKYGGAQGFWSKDLRVEKWKHDLFDEANRSPSPKKEEDPVAKVEALLSM